jgi:hypothetical protein
MVEQTFPAKIAFAACNVTKQGMEKREGHAIAILPERPSFPPAWCDSCICRNKAGAISVLSRGVHDENHSMGGGCGGFACNGTPEPRRRSSRHYKSLVPDVALDLAKVALETCRSRGYQVAVAVVDRFGQPQVMLRDRFAGPHTPSTATNKAGLQ